MDQREDRGGNGKQDQHDAERLVGHKALRTQDGDDDSGREHEEEWVHRVQVFLIRIEESLNFDALGEIDTGLLAHFGIVRRIEESLTIKEAKIALGQAVKAATRRATKAEAKAA